MAKEVKYLRSSHPEEGKGSKNTEYAIGPAFGAILVGREIIFLVAATLRWIGKQGGKCPTKADETMRLPLA